MVGAIQRVLHTAVGRSHEQHHPPPAVSPPLIASMSRSRRGDRVPPRRCRGHPPSATRRSPAKMRGGLARALDRDFRPGRSVYDSRAAAAAGLRRLRHHHRRARHRRRHWRLWAARWPVVRSLPVPPRDRLVYFQVPRFLIRLFTEVERRSRFSRASSVGTWIGPTWTGVRRRTASSSRPTCWKRRRDSSPRWRERRSRSHVRPGDTTVAVLSHGAWTRHFGADPAVVGRTIRIAKLPYTVIGVAPARFFGVAPGLEPELFLPVHGRRPASAFSSLSSSWLHLMGRLKEGISRQQADAVLQTTWPSIMEATTGTDMPSERRAMFLGRRTALEPGRTGFSRVRNLFGEPLRILMALVVLLLAIACASVANLLLARGVAQRKEIAIRLAIGASGGRVFRQLLTESLVLTLAGAAAGLLLASWSGSLIIASLRTSTSAVSLETSPGWRMVAFIGVVAIAVSIVSAWLPAVAATRGQARDALREAGQPGGTLFRRWSAGKVPRGRAGGSGARAHCGRRGLRTQPGAGPGAGCRPPWPHPPGRRSGCGRRGPGGSGAGSIPRDAAGQAARRVRC